MATFAKLSLLRIAILKEPLTTKTESLLSRMLTKVNVSVAGNKSEDELDIV